MKCSRCGNYLNSWDVSCEVCGEDYKKNERGSFTINNLVDWIKLHKAIVFFAVIIFYLIIFK